MKDTRNILKSGIRMDVCLVNSPIEVRSKEALFSVPEASIPTSPEPRAPSPSLFDARLIFVISIMVFFLGIHSGYAEEFGRLFTTPKQRLQLDESRKIKPKVVVEVKEEELIIEEEVVEVPVDTITLRGLVYRSGGKSTAWINNSNTYEGNVASQYTRITQDNIKKDQVQMELPFNDANVNLKVGQTYEPETARTTDITSEPSMVNDPESP